MPLRHQPLFQQVQGREIQKLGVIVMSIARQHDRTESPRIARRSAQQLAVEHDAATHKRADIEIGEVAILASVSGKVLRQTGPRSVIFKDHGQIESDRQFTCYVTHLPFRHLVTGSSQSVQPVPQLEGRADAEPGDPGTAFAADTCAQCRKAIYGECHDLLGQRITICHAQLRPQLAVQVQHAQIGTAAPDAKANAIGTIRVQHHGNRWLPHLAANAITAFEQAVGLKAANDDRNGLGRQAGRTSQIGSRHAAIVQKLG